MQLKFFTVAITHQMLSISGITLMRTLFWSLRATVNIPVRSPRSGISSMNIRPLVIN
jgi:hypothetical protein